MYALSCNGEIIRFPSGKFFRFEDFLEYAYANDLVDDVFVPSIERVKEECEELAKLPDTEICMDASFYTGIAKKIESGDYTVHYMN